MTSINLKLLPVIVGFVALTLNACGGGGSSNSLPDSSTLPPSMPPVTVVVPEAVIVIEGVIGGISAGELIQLNAIRTTAAGIKTDVTAKVTWASSDPRVALIDSNGQLNTITAGIVTLSVMESGASGKVDVTVEPAPKLAQIGGAMQGKVPSLRSRTGLVFAGSDSAIVDGIGSKARFEYPRLAATDGTFLYVADNLKTIRKIEIATGAVLPAIQPNGPVANDPRRGDSRSVCGLAYRAGFLYVSDCVQAVIVRINLATGITTLVAGTAGQGGYVDGPLNTARLYGPGDLAIDADFLYAADGLVIRKISLATGQVTTLLDPTRQRNIRTVSSLNICTEEGSQYIWVVDGFVIRRIDKATGIDRIYAGSLQSSYTTNDGAIQNATFTDITAISCNGGNLYLMEFYNDYSNGGEPNGVSLRRINTTLGVVETIAGGTFQTGFIDGNGTAARFRISSGIVNVSPSKLLVTDTVNETIRVVDIGANVVVSTLAGLPKNADGIGAGARFTSPGGVTTDGVNIFVADSAAHVIRKISIINGQVATLAGLSGAAGSTDGPSDVARFNNPAAIATDGVFVYVADVNNQLVRKISISSGLVTTLAGRRRGSQTDSHRDSYVQKLSGMTELGGYLYVSEGVSIVKISTASGDQTLLTPNIESWDSSLVAQFYGYEENQARSLTSDGISLFLASDASINRVNLVTGAVSALVAFKKPARATDALASISSDGKNIYAIRRSGDIFKVDISSKVVTELYLGNAQLPSNFYNSDLGITTDGFSLFATDYVGGLIRRYR